MGTRRQPSSFPSAVIPWPLAGRCPCHLPLATGRAGAQCPRAHLSSLLCSCTLTACTPLLSRPSGRAVRADAGRELDPAPRSDGAGFPASGLKKLCLSCKDYDCWCFFAGKTARYLQAPKANKPKHVRKENVWLWENIESDLQMHEQHVRLGQQLAGLAFQMQYQEVFGKQFSSSIASNSRSFRGVV